MDTGCRRLPAPPRSWGAVPRSLGTSLDMSHMRTRPSLCPVSKSGCACMGKNFQLKTGRLLDGLMLESSRTRIHVAVPHNLLNKNPSVQRHAFVCHILNNHLTHGVIKRGQLPAVEHPPPAVCCCALWQLSGGSMQSTQVGC